MFQLRTHRSWWLAVAALFGSTLVGCEEPVVEEKAVRVVVTPAIQQDVTILGDYVGRTQASKRVEVNPRVNGFLKQINFVDGSAVESRQVLYKIDAQPYQAAVDRNQAILSSRKASLAKAMRDEERIRPLFQEDAASQLDFDNAVATVQLSRAAVQEAEANLKEAQLELDYTTIKAPIDGLISESRVDEGALIEAGNAEPLTTISQIDPIYLYFSMSALDYLNARRRIRSRYEDMKSEREGKALEGVVSITLPDDSIYRFQGRVGFTDPQVNPKTGTFAIRAVVPNPDRELLPGQYTRVKMPLEIRKDALLIPEECIVIEQGGVYVMVVLPNNRVERRLIFVGPIVDGKMIVEKGLDAGEKLVLHGINKVLHGSLADPISEADYEAELAHQQQQKIEASEAAGQ